MRFIFTSPNTFEKWDFHNPLEIGIGGSETAHVEMAIRLARRGHEVISYTPKPNKKDETFKGVLWKDRERMNYAEKGVWVISREPKLAENFIYTHEGKKLWLVMQDIDYPGAKLSWIKAFDKLFPLCTDHYNYTLKQWPYAKDKIVLSSNGIRTDHIETVDRLKIKRNPFRLMFASSPDRGLYPLLQIFKKAKERIPQLELHVFYGFNNIDKFSTADTPLGMERISKNQILKAMEQPGVFNHGRIGQGKLYLEWFKSGVWCHPSALFPETSCITSMDAQACGAIPITASLWGLKENVKYGYLFDNMPLSDPVARMEYVDAIEDLVIKRMPSEVNKMRKEMMKYARHRFDWEKLVDKYLEMAENEFK